jgi:hypothetical protein
MKLGLYCILLLLVTILAGCHKCDYIVNESQYVAVRVDSNSADTFVMAMMPAINRMDECQSQWVTQMVWMRQNLDKCLKKLEEERGLEPIQQKHQGFYRGDPNFTPPSEPWFEAYEQEKWRPMETPSSVRMLICWMNIHSLNMCNQTHGNDWIDNFEQRMKRLEKYIDESKDANTPAAEQ